MADESKPLEPLEPLEGIYSAHKYEDGEIDENDDTLWHFVHDHGSACYACGQIVRMHLKAFDYNFYPVPDPDEGRETYETLEDSGPTWRIQRLEDKYDNLYEFSKREKRGNPWYDHETYILRLWYPYPF